MFQQNFIMDTKIGISYVMGHEIFFIFFSNHSQLSGHTNTGRAKFNPWIIICQILIQSTRILRWICPQSWNLYVSAYLKKQDRKKKKWDRKISFPPGGKELSQVNQGSFIILIYVYSCYIEKEQAVEPDQSRFRFWLYHLPAL